MRKVAAGNFKNLVVGVPKHLRSRSLGLFKFGTRSHHQTKFQSTAWNWAFVGNINYKQHIHSEKLKNEQGEHKSETESAIEYRELSNEERETNQQQRNNELSSQDIKALRRRYFLYVNMPQIFQILLCLCLVWSTWRLIAVKTILEENSETIKKAKEEVEELQAQLADIKNQLHTRDLVVSSNVEQDPASTKPKFF